MKSCLRLLIISGGILGIVSAVFPAQTNQANLRKLVSQYLPNWRVQTNDTGRETALLSQSGERLELAQTQRENPTPSRTRTIGYWFSPTMDLLGRQEIKVFTAQDAVDVVKLWHTLWRGNDFARQKLYQARAFAGDWVITVEHDFTNYPGNIFATMPYELVLDTNHVLREFRQRCYSYPGSSRIYTNTVTTVYEREIRRDRGRNYPEALFKELHDAWEKEKSAPITKPKE